MHRTALTDEPRAKFPENVADTHQNLPKTMRVLTIIGGVTLVQIKSHWARHFHGHRPYLHLNAQRMQRAHQFGIEFRDSAWRQTEGPGFSTARTNLQIVSDEVENDFERSLCVRYRRCGQAAR